MAQGRPLRIRSLLRKESDWGLLAILYGLSAAGIFENIPEIGWYHWIWIGGFIALAIRLSQKTFKRSGLDQKGRLQLTLLAILPLNALIQITGGIASSYLPVYFLVAVLLPLSRSGIQTAVGIGAMIFLEGFNLLVRFPSGNELLLRAGLVGVLLVLIPMFLWQTLRRLHTDEARLRTTLDRLRDGLEAMEDLPEPQLGGDLKEISPDHRQDQALIAMAQLDQVLENQLAILKAGLPQAHSCLLFLYKPREECLVLHRAVGDPPDALRPQVRIAKGRGLLGWLAQEMRPVRLGSLDAPHFYLEYYSRSVKARSFIAHPILRENRLHGMLCADSLRAEAFDEAAELFLGLMASEVLYVLEGHRERERIKTKTHEFSGLLAVSKALSSKLDLQHRLETMADLTREIVSYDHCLILLMEPGGRRATIKVVRGIEDPDLHETSVPLSDGLLSLIVKNRHELLFSKLPGEADRAGIFAAASRIQIPAKSFLGIPMIVEDRVIGLFVLLSRREDAFSGYEKHTLTIICNQAAQAISDAQLHAQVERMAVTDGLTGILNHRRFQERLAEEFLRIARHPDPISLLLIDIDHFKKFNDAYGHPVGDLILKKIAKVLTRLTRSADIVARYGGEEFVVALFKAESRQAERLAERIRKTIESTEFEAQEQTLRVTVSVGAASCPQDAQTRETLIELADRALYHAKNTGRNRIASFHEVRKALSRTQA
jgi:diguanylate cyclase (GGDEF)-like protein